MPTETEEEKLVLPHHAQQALCTTRLPYRQGRTLTAVKVYTVNNESNHLLVFGVPSINLRQEAKSLLSQYGKLMQFFVTPKHTTEPFTETYHAVYAKIQSARIAKRMIDTKNLYGGSLHVCYAPELETIEETKQKLYQRQRDILNRLRNLNNDTATLTKTNTEEKVPIKTVSNTQDCSKLNMGEINTISIGKQMREVVFNKKNKRKMQQEQNIVIEKKFKPCFVHNNDNNTNNTEIHRNNNKELIRSNSNKIETERNVSNEIEIETNNIEIIDCTSVEKETVTNINEALNYNKFGNEIIRKVPEKPVNRIKFNVGNKNKL